MVKASMDEKKMTGNDRTPAWDGQTMGGVSLSNQMKAIDEHKVRTCIIPACEAVPVACG